MNYKASLDLMAKGITIGVTILFVVIITGQILLIKNIGSGIPLITSILLLAIYFGTFLFRPIRYNLTHEKLIIHRPLADVKIDRKEIKSVKQIDKEQSMWTIRTFGVGGLFGYWGCFTNKKIGAMTWYATRKDKAVLVTTVSDKRIVLTPDEPEQFVGAFN